MVTALGVGSLITQISAIEKRLDPYHTSRSAERLGAWLSRQPLWLQLKKPTPVGPVIFPKLVDGFRGLNVIAVSRLPSVAPGEASWTAILAIFHEHAPNAVYKFKISDSKSGTRIRVNEISTQTNKAFTIDVDHDPCSLQTTQKWASLSTRPLTRHGSTRCIVISRTTLITLLNICNGRTMFATMKLVDTALRRLRALVHLLAS